MQAHASSCPGLRATLPFLASSLVLESVEFRAFASKAGNIFRVGDWKNFFHDFFWLFLASRRGSSLSWHEFRVKFRVSPPSEMLASVGFDLCKGQFAFYPPHRALSSKPTHLDTLKPTPPPLRQPLQLLTAASTYHMRLGDAFTFIVLLLLLPTSVTSATSESLRGSRGRNVIRAS